MRPGRFSQGGFLGPSESLIAVLEQDEATLARLGVTPEQVAARLAALLEQGDQRREHWVRVPPHFSVRVEVWKGFQICPWADPDAGQCRAGGGVRFASADWRLRNTRTSQEVSGPGLLVHLVRAHHFFEGPGSPYRVDPETLCRLLEL